MKKIITLSFLSVLSLAAFAQTPNDTADVSTVTVTPKRADFLAQHRYAMRSDEFYKFKREYELSNGQTVSLFNRGQLMYARLDNGTPERIVATSHNTFLSTKSDLKLKLNVKDDGDVFGEAYLPVVASR